MINSLSVQLEKQAEIKKQIMDIESELSEYINQKEIFNKIKDSLKYGFEVDETVTNTYIMGLKLSREYDNAYLFYIAIDKGYLASNYKYLIGAYIKLNKSNDKLTFNFKTFEKDKITVSEIKKVINLLVGI
jgi:hypothetical protein